MFLRQCFSIILNRTLSGGMIKNKLLLTAAIVRFSVSCSAYPRGIMGVTCHNCYECYIKNDKYDINSPVFSAMEDDDVPQLSAETFAALQEFYTEQAKREEIFEKLKANNQLKENVLFDENWQLSQFWYDEATVQSLVKVVDKIAPARSRVGLVSCPTLFVPIKRQIGHTANVILMEYDRRFEVHGADFCFYDYNEPTKLPTDYTHSFDVIIVDPPFLSEECLTSITITVQLMAKEQGKIVLCTGAVMKEHVDKLLGLKLCHFKPNHKNNLANEFSCYANFDLDSLLS